LKNKIVTGKALIIWDDQNPTKKKDNIDTDQITPSSYCVSKNLDDLDVLWKEGAFRYLLPQFKQRVQQGENFLVVGNRFGIGSSREMSPAGLKAIAEDVGLELVIICGNQPGSIFLNNSFNLGLYILECPLAVEEMNEGDHLEFHKSRWELINLTQRKFYRPSKPNSYQRKILSYGGIFNIGRTEFSNLKQRGKVEVKWPEEKQKRYMTTSEQIIWSHRVDKTANVKLGETIKVYTDLAPVSDGTAPFAIYTFNNIVNEENVSPLNAAIANDHFVFTDRADDHQQMLIAREFAKIYNIVNPYYASPGDGIFHFYFPEQGLIKPGGFYAGADSHSRAYGAYGAMGIGVGSTTAGFGWATGYIYFTPAKQRRVTFYGKLNSYATGKDIALNLLSRWGGLQAQGMSIEFIDADKQIPMFYRNTIANMMAEAEAQSGIFAPDEITLEWFRKKNILIEEQFFLKAGINAYYEINEEINLADIKPLIAKPYSPSNTEDAEELAKKRIKFNKALIGSCTNGGYEDLFSAAFVFFKAKQIGISKIYKNTQLIIYPGSKLVSQQMEIRDSRLGGESIAEIFRSVGGIIRDSWCGPCFGQGIDRLSQGERAITTFNRNWQNRIGIGGEGYLASPPIVAASALLGYMAPPSELKIDIDILKIL
jgi:3-isopropylmalate/(R)-2-methylmalate dehydratase large subunit